MKKFLLLSSVFIISHSILKGQSNWDGAWQGKIEVANLRLVFNIKSAENGNISATMDSPDQSAFGLAVQSANVKQDSIFIEDSRYKIYFSGKRINDTTINGVFTQGIDIPLVLKRSTLAEAPTKSKTKRQTPVPPFPYKEEEVTIDNNKAGVKLSATLTIPAGSNGKGYPAVILISGSGAQDRDESIFSHKPFAVLADHLTRQGMVVLRYDDRGTGRSTGDFSSSTSLDFKMDAEAALQFLMKRPEVDVKKIGMIGHSEGGMIAPMVANDNKKIHFIILLAGPGVPVYELMKEQNVAILKSNGIDAATAGSYGKLYSEVIDVVRKNLPTEEKTRNVIAAAELWEKRQTPGTLATLGLGGEQWKENFATQMIEQTSGKWMQYFLNYDPQPALQKLNTKVLALNGDKDNQVIAKSNLAGIESALKRSKSASFKIVSLEGLNHLFQNCKSCTISEYATIEETISPSVLNEISSWLKEENILSK